MIDLGFVGWFLVSAEGYGMGIGSGKVDGGNRGFFVSSAG